MSQKSIDDILIPGRSYEEVFQDIVERIRLLESVVFATDSTHESKIPIGPKNNDGRDRCFWCDTPTEKRQGLMELYDFCPKCGK